MHKCNLQTLQRYYLEFFSLYLSRASRVSSLCSFQSCHKETSDISLRRPLSDDVTSVNTLSRRSANARERCVIRQTIARWLHLISRSSKRRCEFYLPRASFRETENIRPGLSPRREESFHRITESFRVSFHLRFRRVSAEEKSEQGGKRRGGGHPTVFALLSS